MIYKAIKYILETDLPFAAAIGTDGNEIKAYPIYPRKEVSIPFCTFRISSLTSNPAKDLRSYLSLDEISIRVTIYHDNLESLISLSELARVALDDKKEGGTFNGIEIQSIDFEGLSDGFDGESGDHGLLLMNLDFKVWS